jgi:hypothetical protein
MQVYYVVLFVHHDQSLSEQSLICNIFEIISRLNYSEAAITEIIQAEIKAYWIYKQSTGMRSKKNQENC